jgi:hypothetical protein
LNRLDIRLPLTGFYDAPDPGPFKPTVRPKTQGRHACVFMYFHSWKKGITLDLTASRAGCRGCARALFGRETRDRGEFLNFLALDEGLKESPELMGRWLDHDRPYEPVHDHLLIGPYRKECQEFLRSVTFWVNPDQLSALVIGAHYHHRPDDPVMPVKAPFGSGCMQLVSLFDDLNLPQAVIGSTDLAMRHHVPPDILAFTVTVPLFHRLCELNDRSFLGKAFLSRLQKSRR